jgi:hypothetical protein
MNYPALRTTLKCGSIVFGASALFLLALPSLFLELLALETTDELTWSMRMIGLTVFALAGNMCISATALGALTLMIPAELTWFTYLYAAVGFGFGVAYVVGMVSKK